MARIFMDGFETGDVSMWTSSVSITVTASPPAGMSGSYYGNFGSSASYLEKLLSESKAELYFAFKYSFTNTATLSVLAFRDSASTWISHLTINSTTNTLDYRAGTAASTVVASGSKRLEMYRVYLIEVRYKPLNSGGVFTVKIDGVQDINYSGDTTAGLENIQYIRLGCGSSGQGNSTHDDFVVDDANWIGNTKLGIIVPDGTGTTNNWTASAGNAWDCLNEKPPVDTDYVYSNTTNQIATYAMTTIANMNTVKSIQLQGRAAYEGSPTPTKIQLGVRASGADYFATDLSPGISFGMLTKILELNPADSAAFEQADIDALEVGIKATA